MDSLCTVLALGRNQTLQDKVLGPLFLALKLMTDLRICTESSLGWEGRGEGRDMEIFKGERTNAQTWEMGTSCNFLFSLSQSSNNLWCGL